MKAFYISHNPGARGFRMMEALADQVEWHLFHRVAYRGDASKLARLEQWNTWEELQKLLEAEKDEPKADFWLVTQQIGCEWLPPLCSINRFGKVPLIVDVRDMQSMVNRVVVDQGGEQLLECITFAELATMRAADGILHVSPGCSKTAELLHPQTRGTQQFILPCLVRQAELVPVDQLVGYDARAGVVYSGGIGPCDEPTFRNYGELLERMVLTGVDVHLQAGISRENPMSNWVLDQYAARGIVVHDRVADQQLTSELSRFRWGLVGFPKAFPLGNAAFPNKLFEYLAAGVPPVVVNAFDAGSWVDEHKIGFWVRCEEDFHRLPELLTEERWRHSMANLLELRAKWTYDAQAPELLGWLKKVSSRAVSEPGGIWIGSTLIRDPYAEALAE